MRFGSFFTYAFFISLPFFWWTAAFKNHNAFEPQIIERTSSDKPNKLPYDIQSLAAFPDRELLRKALLGDFKLMASLISEWDINAELLVEQGFQNIKRLDRTLFLRSQMIGRLLENREMEEKAFQENLLPIIDERGFPHDASFKRRKSLPQTYMAAGVLMGLASPEEIAALPKGFKLQTAIYASNKLEAISAEFDRFASESLALDFPDIAFVSSYSHPTSLDILTHLGIEIFFIPDINSFEDVENIISSIGALIGKPLLSELLNIFVKAAVNACDNSLEVFQEETSLDRTLIVNYYTHFSIPGKKSLTCYLMEKLTGKQWSGKEMDSFSTPLSEEEIVFLNPEKMIILANPNEALEKSLLTKESLQNVSAIKSRKLILIPEDVQWTPSQFLILAYYDLAKALCD